MGRTGRRGATCASACAALALGLLLAPAASSAQAPDEAGPETKQAGEAGADEPQVEETAPAAEDTSAEDVAARALFQRGVELAQEERWGEAVEFFRRSMQDMPRASTAYNLAVSLQRMGRPTEALEAIERLRDLADPKQDAERLTAAEELESVARGSVATLHLSVLPGTAVVSVNGEPQTGEGAERDILLDPGTHRLRFSAEGFHSASRTVSVLPGGETEVSVMLEQLPPPPDPKVIRVVEEIEKEPEPAGPIPWTLAAGSVASTVSGVVLLVLAAREQSEIDDVTPDDRLYWFDDGFADRQQKADRMRISGSVLIGVGVASAATSLAWRFWLSEDGHTDVQAHLGSISLTGRF